MRPRSQVIGWQDLGTACSYGQTSTPLARLSGPDRRTRKARSADAGTEPGGSPGPIIQAVRTPGSQGGGPESRSPEYHSCTLGRPAKSANALQISGTLQDRV